MSGVPSLIAVHVPKTAGTSFRTALHATFGERLHLDYHDRPLFHSRRRRRLRALAEGLRNVGRDLGERCVFGHFMPLKYRWVRGARYVIWLRDPVDRILSRYRHYLTSSSSNDPAERERSGLTLGLTLDEFIRLPRFQNTAAEYLWGFGLSRFDFIGLAEHFEEDVARFARRFANGRPLPIVRDNVSPDHGPLKVTAATRALIRAFNAKDVALYEQAVAHRNAAIARGE